MAEDVSYDILSYRKDVVEPILRNIKSGESCFVVGAPSVGKTRLMDFLMGDYLDEKPVNGEAIKQHYLGTELASRTWLVRVDMNRIGKEHDWGFCFYELLLSSLLVAAFRHRADESLITMLGGLDSDVMEGKDSLKAHRFFEMAVSRLCQFYSLKLCFLFDEFDETYKLMPPNIFSQLRAVRDANKYSLSYALFLRNLPEKLRTPQDNESFYELLSRNMIGLGPLNRADSFRMLTQLERRKEFPLSPDKHEWIYGQSGGHPGLLQGLYSLLKENPLAELKMSDLEWLVNQDVVFEELRKIWNGLLDDEKAGVLAFAQGKFESVDYHTAKLLMAKGIVTHRKTLFSPLLAAGVARM
jgi:energy-coupling factor transporter ATP-binding protein EcfA2